MPLASRSRGTRMRAELAPFLIDATLAIAGLGILAAFGLLPRGPWGALGALGLGYMAGAAAVPLLITALLTAGVPFTLTTYFLILLACVGCGLLRLRKHP